MKIALSFPGCHGRGGVERLLLESANFLAARGHDVHVLASEFDSDALHPCICKHHVPASRHFSLLHLISYAQQCPKVLEKIHPAPVAHGAFGVVSPPGGVVNVQSVHRAWIEASQRLRSFGGRLRQTFNPTHPFLLTLERHHFGERNYSKLIAPTEQVKADLMRFYQVPERDIAIVPNGYAPEQLNAARSETLRPGMRRSLGYREQDFVVLFVANELERKGFGPLLHAIARLKNPHLQLLAVVGRSRPESYQGKIKRLGLQDHVRFLGPKKDLAPYYAAADALALPTQYEAWGLVIVEALACGTRVLTSRLAGAAVTVREGETGELLDTPENVSEIAMKLEHLMHCGQIERAAVSASVQKFTWANVLEGYEMALKSSLSEPA